MAAQCHFVIFPWANMALQNIGASNSDDAFYRYKMPKMITKIEGRGNGIKTNIVNMVDIAKALHRPASYTTKYFGCELGAQSKFDEKTFTSLVNGAHDTAKLAGLLENFIKKYVQCYGCGNPETEIIITKTQMITLKCAACGFVSDVDMRDKLTTFILKNPPEQKKASKDKKGMRRAEKERLKEGEAADEEQKKLKKETKKKGTVSSKDGAGSKREEKNVNQEKKEEALKIGPEVVEKPSTHNQLIIEIKAMLKKGSKPSELSSSMPGSHQEIMNALFEALFEGAGKGFAKEVDKKKKHLAAAVQDEESQMCLLRAMEAFCGKFVGDAVKEVSLAAKSLYDGDVLEEECIMKWYKEGLTGASKSSAVWKNIKPFIEWLQNAESESEDEFADHPSADRTGFKGTPVYSDNSLK
ncbi:hypothetical protein C4D60_Mb08t24870 [Musa balbisiana]|uniref:W2 domain-containing protein n=1 Tax=Musa balbisiana TaxID=52838 RepID=A0A4S8K6B5_MUSBA|nr:hypothetical protein C4D60_Mb08t24870 [Musa balbisiana]